MEFFVIIAVLTLLGIELVMLGITLWLSYTLEGRVVEAERKIKEQYLQILRLVSKTAFLDKEKPKLDVEKENIND